MRTQELATRSAYGAFELKRAYQKNMLAGTLISCALPLAIIASLILMGMIGVKAPAPVQKEKTEIVSTPIPPPRIQSNLSMPVVFKKDIPVPKFGVIPKAVHDSMVNQINVPLSRIEKKAINKSSSADGDGNAVYACSDLDQVYRDLLPDTGQFVPHDTEPVLLNPEDCLPEYPEMARKAGVEGKVWVQILVDQEGIVRDAIIAREAGVNAGFEEAALEAALKRKYSPAMQNKNPVAVWISYKVSFKLK
jgi:protein TonB